jgi:hypothetical protein
LRFVKRGQAGLISLPATALFIGAYLVIGRIALRLAVTGKFLPRS